MTKKIAEALQYQAATGIYEPNLASPEPILRRTKQLPRIRCHAFWVFQVSAGVMYVGLSCGHNSLWTFYASSQQDGSKQCALGTTTQHSYGVLGSGMVLGFRAGSIIVRSRIRFRRGDWKGALSDPLQRATEVQNLAGSKTQKRELRSFSHKCWCRS